LGNTIPVDAALKFHIPVALVFYPFPIHYLRIAAVNTSQKSISRILNSLQENDYLTISDVMNATLEELGNARNFGERGQSLLLSLLQTLSEKPELIFETGKLDQILRAEVERIKQMAPIKQKFYEMGLHV